MLTKELRFSAPDRALWTMREEQSPVLSSFSSRAVEVFYSAASWVPSLRFVCYSYSLGLALPEPRSM